jgi:predicted O-methyltransferase YrrM
MQSADTNHLHAAPQSLTLPAFRPIRQPLTRMPRFRWFAAGVFRVCQKLGINVTPRHFYWPIPDLDVLSQKDWTACSLSDGVILQLDKQLRLLETELLPFCAECNFPEEETECEHEFHFNNRFFERVDAEIAYALVRYLRPRRIVEIGGGQTTRLLAATVRRNAEEEARGGELVAIEPRPDPVLKRGFPGLSTLQTQRVQQVPMEMFTALEEGDILFIDSSHVVAIDSDVIHEYLRILPKLKPGVVIHVHDIFMPADYPRKFVMTNLCFWGEQYLLEAFLSYNHAFEVLWASSAMQLFHRAKLERYFPGWAGSYLRMPRALRFFTPTLDGSNVWPCSFWMRKVA